MHTATNCYLFSLAISDTVTLVLGMIVIIVQLLSKINISRFSPYRQCWIKGKGAEDAAVSGPSVK